MLLLMLSFLQKVDQLKRYKVSLHKKLIFKLCLFRWNQSESFDLGKLLCSFVIITKKKIFSFFPASFLSFLGVLVSISKGQVSARTIKSLRLESTHKSGKLICMCKIVCSWADIQSKWLKELLAVKDVSWRGKEWKQTRLLGIKIKAVLSEPLSAGSHADLGRF